MAFIKGQILDSERPTLEAWSREFGCSAHLENWYVDRTLKAYLAPNHPFGRDDELPPNAERRGYALFWEGGLAKFLLICESGHDPIVQRMAWVTGRVYDIRMSRCLESKADDVLNIFRSALSLEAEGMGAVYRERISKYELEIPGQPVTFFPKGTAEVMA